MSILYKAVSALWNRFFFYGIITLFLSCRKTEITNIDVQPDSERLGLVSVDTATVIAFTQKDDSIRTDNVSLHLLGKYNDPVFGSTEAALYTQLSLSSTGTPFTNPQDFVVDSVVLSLAYAGFYGTFEKQNFTIFEIAENLISGNARYSTYQPKTKLTELGYATGIIPKPSDSITVGNSKEPAQLRIVLNYDFGDLLLWADPSVFSDNNTFSNFFKGIYVKPTSSVQSSGQGAILYFNLASPFSRVTLYYKNKISNEAKTYNFTISSASQRGSYFKQNHPLTISQATKDTLTETDYLYLQSMGGTRTKIKLPFLDLFVKNNYSAISKAEFILNTDELLTGKYDPHPNLFLIAIDSLGSTAFIPDQLIDPDRYGGVYNTSTKQYIFDITRYCQYLITNLKQGRNYNYGFYLMPGGKAINARRTIIKGSSTADSKRIKFRLSYTPFL